MFVFQMTSAIAEEFWKRVIERKAETEKERAAILLEMAEAGLLLSVSETNRTKDEYVNDLRKEFEVLDMTKEEENEGC